MCVCVPFFIHNRWPYVYINSAGTEAWRPHQSEKVNGINISSFLQQTTGVTQELPQPVMDANHCFHWQEGGISVVVVFLSWALNLIQN